MLLPPPSSLGGPVLTNPARFLSRGSKLHPSHWSAFTEVHLTTGNLGHGENIPQAKLARANLFQQTGNFTLKTLSGNLTGKADFQGQGCSFQISPKNLYGVSRELALTSQLPPSSSRPKKNKNKLHTAFLFHRTVLGCWGRQYLPPLATPPEGITSPEEEKLAVIYTCLFWNVMCPRIRATMPNSEYGTVRREIKSEVGQDAVNTAASIAL